jgi:hypothetical protein
MSSKKQVQQQNKAKQHKTQVTTTVKQSPQQQNQKKKSSTGKGNRKQKQRQTEQAIKTQYVNKILTSSHVKSIIEKTTPIAQGLSTIKRESTISPGALSEFFLAFLGRLIQLGVNFDPEVDLSRFYSGFRYMIQSCLLMIQGSAGVNQLPAIINDWVNALKAKSVSFHTYGAISFGWNPIDTAAAIYTVLAAGTGSLKLMINGPDSGTWNAPATEDTLAYSAEDYPYYLKIVNDLSKIPSIARCLRTVNCESHKSVLARDVSAFARIYPYFGFTGDQTTGIWNNAESLVDIKSTLCVGYNPYPSSGPITFISNKLVAVSGGTPRFLQGMIDIPSSYWNKVPVVYKFLDFMDVVNRLLAWYRAAIIKLQTIRTINPTLNMTYQDFLIIVRQMILRNAPAQAVTQFEGLNTIGNSNYFQAFMVSASTSPSAYYEEMKMPLILAENLAMLQPFSFRFNYRNTSPNSFCNYLPVWGQFVLDPRANPTVEVNGVDVPIFLPATTGGQLSVNLIDGRIGGPSSPTYVNLNADHYQGCMNVWNEQVSLFQDVSVTLGTNTKAYCGKVPYAMMVTNLVTTTPGEQMKPNPKWEKMLKHYWGPRDVLPDVPGKRQSLPKLPPGTPNNLHNYALSSAIPIPKEIFGLLNYCVKPVARLDIDPGTFTPLSDEMVRCYAGEALLYPYDKSSSPTFIASAEYFGDFCTTGIGRDSNNEYDNAMVLLSSSGEGSQLFDFLADAVGTIIPGMGPIAKGIAKLF